MEAIADADSKAAAFKPQRWLPLQRIRASVAKLTADPQPDVEAPAAETVSPVPYYSLFI